ncbi:MAG: carboxypeptidase-like regulatory domain-containing protein, partial [Planctomycetota bacterium]
MAHAFRAGAVVEAVANQGVQRQKGKVEPGTLTAGSYDDSVDTASFRKLSNRVLQSGEKGCYSSCGLGGWITVRVEDAVGAPVANARVTLKKDKGEVHKTLTRNNGVARIFLGDIGEADGGKRRLGVVPPGMSREV